MTQYVDLDVSQKMTAICVVDAGGRRIWRGVCASAPEDIEQAVQRHAGCDAHIGIETGPMTPWLVHGLRGRGLDVVCLDARHARAALRMQLIARTLLYEAAVVLLTRVKRASSLKDWALAIARRSGPGKARVALARKLAVILHSIWRSGEPFRWSTPATASV